MAEVLLFHHAQGQTEGFAAFADELRRAGHTVHTPDLYDGRTFASIEEGMAFVEQLGFGEIIDRGERAANELPNELVYAGFSLGVVPVQIHGMDADPIFVDEGDLDAARALVESTEHAELFLYPGDQHYFADSSLPSYDADAAALLTQRVLDFLRSH
jgi:dienelactone hydrolase